MELIDQNTSPIPASDQSGKLRNMNRFKRFIAVISAFISDIDT
jgi:hypothetical protein